MGFPANNFNYVAKKMNAIIYPAFDPDAHTSKEKREILQAAKDVIQDYKLKYKDAWKKEFKARAPALFQTHPYCLKQLQRFHLY